MTAVIGIDFGTQSARALMVDAATGQTLHSAGFRQSFHDLPSITACAAGDQGDLAV